MAYSISIFKSNFGRRKSNQNSFSLSFQGSFKNSHQISPQEFLGELKSGVMDERLFACLDSLRVSLTSNPVRYSAPIVLFKWCFLTIDFFSSFSTTMCSYIQMLVYFIWCHQYLWWHIRFGGKCNGCFFFNRDICKTYISFGSCDWIYMNSLRCNSRKGEILLRSKEEGYQLSVIKLLYNWFSTGIEYNISVFYTCAVYIIYIKEKKMWQNVHSLGNLTSCLRQRGWTSAFLFYLHIASQTVTRCVWCCGKRQPTASPQCASLLGTLENWSLCWVLLCTAVLLALKERSSNTYVPGNWKESLLIWNVKLDRVPFVFSEIYPHFFSFPNVEFTTNILLYICNRYDNMVTFMGQYQ